MTVMLELHLCLLPFTIFCSCGKDLAVLCSLLTNLKKQHLRSTCVWAPGSAAVASCAESSTLRSVCLWCMCSKSKEENWNTCCFEVFSPLISVCCGEGEQPLPTNAGETKAQTSQRADWGFLFSLTWVCVQLMPAVSFPAAVTDFWSLF